MTRQVIRTAVTVMPGGEVSFGELPSVISMHPVVRGAATAIEAVVADDAGGFCAVWEAEPGVYTRVKDKRGSAMLILSGDAVVSDLDGTAHEVREGSVLVLPYRWEGTWDIQRTIRKVYIYSWPTGEPSIRPAKATSRAGVEYAGQTFSTVLTPTEHGGSLPPVRADIVTEDVDGLCALIQLEAGSFDVSAGPRWAYLYVQGGQVTFRGSDGEVTASAGAVVAIPRAWAGSLQVDSDLSAFAFFTAEKQDDGAPATLRGQESE